MRKRDRIINVIRKKNRIYRFLHLIFGAFILGLIYNAFIVPNNLVYGGISGLSIVISKITGISPTLFLNIVTLGLCIISFFILGAKETSYAVVGFFAYDIMINLTAPIAKYFTLEFDSFLFSVILYAVIDGIGCGILYKTGFNTGGSDSIIAICQHFFKKPISNISNFLNTIIIIFGASTFGIVKSVYAIIYLKTMNFISNRVLIGVSDSKFCLITTRHKEKLEEYLNNELEVGYTLLNYTNGIGILSKSIIMCVVPSDRFYDFKRVLISFDKKCTLISSDCYAVEGGKTNKILKV